MHACGCGGVVASFASLIVGISTEDRFAPVDIRRIRIASETRRPALPKTPSIEPRLAPSEPPQLPTRDCRLALLRSVPAPGLIADEMPRPRAPKGARVPLEDETAFGWEEQGEEEGEEEEGEAPARVELD